LLESFNEIKDLETILQKADKQKSF